MANFAVALKDIKKLPGWQSFSLLRYDTTPWTPPAQPISESRVALVTTAGVVRRDDRPFNPRGDSSWRKIASDTQLETQTRILHDGYLHRDTDLDVNCVFPLDRLRELSRAGFCRLAPLHASLMGLAVNPKPVRDKLGREIADALAAAGTDLVLLTPGCTISHQAMCLVARQIESQGMPTVCVSVTREVTDEVKVPRTAYLRFPLGHPFGHPGDENEQTEILKGALEVFQAITEPGGTVVLPFTWTAEYLQGVRKP